MSEELKVINEDHILNSNVYDNDGKIILNESYDYYHAIHHLSEINLESLKNTKGSGN